MEEGLAEGLRYAHEDTWRLSPSTTWGTHGADALDVLERESAVRRILLGSFGEAALDPGEQPELLFERLVPVYFHHRYGLEAAANTVCGLEFSHARYGDGQLPPRPVDAELQGRGLEALIKALEPEELAVPESASSVIPPRHPAYRPFDAEVGVNNREFAYAAYPVIENSPEGGFDPLAWARALSRRVVSLLPASDRLERCAAQHARDSDLPGVAAVLGHLVEGTWGAPTPREPMAGALRRVTQRVVLDQLLALAEESTRSPEVRAAAFGTLVRLEAELRKRLSAGGPEEQDHLLLALRDIGRLLEGRRL